jgi:hypothetical protein
MKTKILALVLIAAASVTLAIDFPFPGGFCWYSPAPCGCIQDVCSWPDQWVECCCFFEPCYSLCECNIFGSGYCEGWRDNVCG